VVVTEGVRWFTRCAVTGRNCWAKQAVLASRENGSDSDPVQGHVAVSEGQCSVLDQPLHGVHAGKADGNQLGNM
jgi:hypothetical protein